MANTKSIDPRELTLAPVKQLLDDWMLLTAGSLAVNDYNSMTVAWGFVGAMWGKPVAIAPVRNTRFTYDFMERHDTWTLSGFPESYRDTLNYLGTNSGRDGDKIAESGLTPVPSSQVAAPSFSEAILTIECRTLYFNNIDPRRMRDRSLDKHYNSDYHRMYYGEIVAVREAD